MGAFDFKSTGFRELDRKLENMERASQRKLVLPILRKGATVIAREERRLVPVRTGDLKRRISVTANPGFDLADARSDITIYIGPRRGGDGSIAHMVEWGTARSAAEPFARPAVANRGEEAISLVLSGLSGLVKDAAS